MMLVRLADGKLKYAAHDEKRKKFLNTATLTHTASRACMEVARSMLLRLEATLAVGKEPRASQTCNGMISLGGRSVSVEADRHTTVVFVSSHTPPLALH